MTDTSVTLNVVMRRDGIRGVLPLLLTESTTDTQVCIRIADRAYKSVFEARDYFEALAQLRAQLEVEGVVLCCNGARIDVYPSRMSRQMSAGRKAYEMKLVTWN